MLFLSWYLWVVPHIVVGVCLMGLLLRPGAQAPSMFVGYLIVQVVSFFCLLPPLILHFPSATLWYERINIADLAASELFTLGAIYQLTNELALSRLPFRDAVRSLMRWTLAVLLLVAAVMSALFQNSSLRSTWKVFQMMDFSGNLIKLGLLLALLLFTRALHISWRSLPAGIVLGFGIDGSVELSAATLFSVLRQSKNLVLLDAVRMSAFHVCVLIWLVYIFLPEKQPGFTGHKPDRTDLEAWDHELQKMVR